MKKELEKIKKEIEEGTAVLFDVREKEEWDGGHLKFADFIPLSQLKEGIAPQGKDFSKKTYIHCRSGKRVLMAKPLLKTMGFENIIGLNEGYAELVENEFQTA